MSFRYSMVAILTATALLVSCTASAPSPAATASPVSATNTAASPAASRTLTIGLPLVNVTLDPHKVSRTLIAEELIFEPILARDASGKIVPNLAESWDVSADGKTWTLKLRKGVKFHSGAPFNAAALKKTYDRFRAPETKAVAAAVQLGPLAQVDVVDEYTLRLGFTAPYPLFWYSLTTPFLAPFDPTVLDKDPDKFGEHPSSTGPYRFVQRTPSEVILERNPDYTTIRPDVRNKGAAKYDKVVIRTIPDPETLLLELEKGNVQYTNELAANSAKRAQSIKGVQMLPESRTWLDFVAMNNKKWPFTEQAVRTAISFAIDRAPLVAVALDGLGEPIYGNLAPDTFGYAATSESAAKSAYPFDVGRAKKVLADAGYTVGADGILVSPQGQPLKATMWVWSTGAEHQKMAQIIQSQLRQIGMAIELQNVEVIAILDGMGKGEHQMALWAVARPDADLILTYLFDNSRRTGFSSPAATQLLLKARTTIDEQERKEAYDAVQRLLIEQRPTVPLVVRYTATAVRNEVTSVRLNDRGMPVVVDLGY